MSLRKLDVSANLLGGLGADSLTGLPALQHLILEQNPLTDVTQDAFDQLPMLREINTDAFKFCCIAKQAAVCTPEPDEFSSCEDLMSNYTLQVGRPSLYVL